MFYTALWAPCQDKSNSSASSWPSLVYESFAKVRITEMSSLYSRYFVRNGISVWNAGIRLSGVACLLHGLKWLLNHFSLFLENKPVLLLYFLLWSLYELLINCAIPWHCFFVNPSVTWWLASFHLVQCLLSSSLFYL